MQRWTPNHLQQTLNLLTGAGWESHLSWWPIGVLVFSLDVHARMGALM